MITTLPKSKKKSISIFDKGKHFVSNMEYINLPEKIKDYLIIRFEGFLIKNTSFCEKTAEYKLSIERGNLEVNLIFTKSSELTQIHFDY